MPSTQQRPTYHSTSTSPSSPSFPANETEIYSVAKVAYSKLVSEASLKDQNLRRLVGHANLYDKLLDEYNNCLSDSESDTESFEEDDTEEFASQAYYATPVKTYSANLAKGDVEIREGTTYIYQARSQDGEVLRKVASHADNLGFHVLGEYAEVEVKELEEFDE